MDGLGKEWEPVRLSGCVLGGLLALLAWVLTEAPCEAKPRATADIPRIDVHTHVFNFHSLPIASLLRSRGVPEGVATAVGRWLDRHTDSDGLAAARDEGDPGPTALTRPEKDAIAEYLGDHGLAKERYFSFATEEDEELVIRTLREAGFATDGDSHDEEEGSLKRLGLLGWGSFVRELRKPESQIAGDLRRTYSGPERSVDLFIHHMMDMQQAYGGAPPRHPFADQVRRMHELTRGAGGALLTFVAYDPFRHADSFALIKEAVDAGALGVKIYPPSSYRPTSNEVVPAPRSGFARLQWEATHGRVTAAQLDANLGEVFAWAEAAGVPLFTHCTSKGFEAHADAGLKASPEYWALVLQEHPDLRLCFGHAGGHPGWFARKEQAWAESYARGVVELCRRYDNVYAGVGYLDGVLSARKRKRFQSRLSREVGLQRGSSHDLGRKLLYGTDWHMTAKVEDHELFPVAFDKVMEAPQLVRYRASFFAGNASRFLDLPRYLARIEALGESAPVDDGGRRALRTLLARIAVAEGP